MLMFPWYAIHHKINFAEKPSPASDSAWINSLKYNEQMRGGELYCCDASGRVWVVPAHLQPDGKIKMGKEPKAWPKAHNLGKLSAALPRSKPPFIRFLRHHRQRMRGGGGGVVHCIKRPHVSTARCCQRFLQANAKCDWQVQVLCGMYGHTLLSSYNLSPHAPARFASTKPARRSSSWTTRAACTCGAAARRK